MRLDHLLSKESHRVGEAYRNGTGSCSCVMGVVVVLISDSTSSGSRVMRGWDVAGWNTNCRYVNLRARFGTLLGPEETPGWCSFLASRSWLGPLMRLVGCGGVWMVGVWLCVECCIVDASILLWSSC